MKTVHSLIIQTDFIPGRGGAAANETRSSEELAKRVASLPEENSEGTARELIALLLAFNRSGQPRRRDIHTLEVVRGRAEAILPGLQARLNGASTPLTRTTREQAHVVEKLLKELAAAYTRLVLAPAPLVAFGLKQQLYPPLVVALDLVSRRLLLTYQFYARRPRLVWKTLHALYRQAVAWHLETLEVDAAKHSALSVYRAALLTALADPSRLGSGELQRVRDYIARFGDEASITWNKSVTQSTNIFVLEGRRDRPGIELADQPDALKDGGAWLLATRRLVERSQFHLSQLQAGMSLRELGLPNDPDPARYRDLLQRLATNWQGKRRPRAARQHFWPRAEIRVGFASAWKLLNEIESESDRDMAKVLRNEWTIRNESPGGFALRHINGTVAALNVGELIGVHMNGRSDSYVCIVRWIKSDNREHLEIGLQQVAPRLVPVSFGGDGSDDTDAQPIFFAPVSPEFNRVPVIIAPAQLVRPGCDFQIRYIGADIHLHSVRTLETTPYLEIVQVRPR